VTQVIIDTGPLVAFFDRDAELHGWVCDRFRELTAPLLCCEPVLTETLFLLKRSGLSPDWAIDLVERGELICRFHVADEITAIRRLLRKYRDLPATLADVCLVRMSEIHRASAVMTFDHDFQIYRRNGRNVIPLIAPFRG